MNKIRVILRCLIISWSLMSLSTIPVGFAESSGNNLKDENALSVGNMVSQELAVAIAREKAEEVWGKVILGKLVLAYRLSGTKSVYIIPIKFGKGTFDSDAMILQEIKKSKVEMDKAGKKLQDIRRSISIKSKDEKEYIESIEGKVLVPINEELANAEKEYKAARDRRWGVGMYGFIAVSATRDKLPIQEFSNTLPYYYTRINYATMKANKVLGENARLSKIFYAGPMDQLFEFSVEDEKVWVSPFYGRVYRPGDISEKDITIINGARDSIEEAWKKWILRTGVSK